MLELNCLRLGDPLKRAFPVKIDQGETVGHLKNMIKEENKHAFAHLDAPSIRVSLVSIPRDHIKAPLQDLTQFEPRPMDPLDRLNEYFPQQPEYCYLHILVETPPMAEPERPSKRIRISDDGSLVIERWRSNHIQSELPTIAELARLVDLPLSDDEKIPIPAEHMQALVSSALETYDICTSDDVKILFREGHHDPRFFQFYSTVVQRPPRDGTKESFHYFWDENIRKVLEFIIPSGASIRNSSNHTATESLRPAYAFLLSKLCPFRGEEKAPGSLDNPKSELADKLAWAYTPAPYVLGYCAKGPNLTLVAISPPPPQRFRPVVHNIAYANLSLRRDRIRNIRRLINLSGLFQSLADLVRPSDAEFEISTRDNSDVEIAGHCVVKTYTSPDKVQRVVHLQNIYRFLAKKNVPHVDSLMDQFDTTLVLDPRGIAKLPGTEQELLEALICVLEALEVLHQAPPLFHRDICWPNVIRRLDDPRGWFLIDWEDAAAPPTKALPHFTKRSHSPHIFADGHGAEVDMWGAGELIAQSRVVGVSSELQNLGKWMQDSAAPSAREALHKIKSYQSSHY